MGGAQRTKSGHGGGKNHCKQQQQQQQPLRIEDAALPRTNNASASEDANKCDNEVRELQRASKVGKHSIYRIYISINNLSICIYCPAGNQSQQSPHHETNLCL